MSQVSTAPTPLGEDQIRQIVNRWNGAGFFRITNLGDKIMFDEVKPCRAWTVRLRTQYEDRAVASASAPYAGGSVDDAGEPPDVWEIEVETPHDFGDRTQTLAVPHTERVTMCPRCAGFGRTDCAACHATGNINCPHCQGKGFRERKEARPTHDANGNPTTEWVTVTDACTCAGGKVTCQTCNGNGRLTCPACAGSGRTKVYEQLTVTFRAASARAVLDETALPDNLIAGARGVTVADRRVPRLDGPALVSAAVDGRVSELLQKALAIDERGTRVLFQHLHVEEITIHEVRYRYAGVTRTLWIYGDDQQVHAPGAPSRWYRLYGMAAAVLGIVALVVLLVLLIGWLR